MRIYENGIYRNMTAEEVAAMQDAAARAEAKEKRRPLSLGEVQEMMVRQQINSLTVDDTTALRMVEFYPKWEELIGKTVDKAGFRFTYGGFLYKTIPANHTFSGEWKPGVGTESLYTRIDVEHTGYQSDPIPYDGNMELTEGLYYTQDGVIYRCTRSTGQPVYHALSDLVGIYVETVESGKIVN